MIAGIDFPSLFERDNFTSRRTTGHNWFDPESFITGTEVRQGLTYTNSARNWASEAHYHLAVSGELSTDQIAATAPRRLIQPDLSGLVYECWAVARLWEAVFV